MAATNYRVIKITAPFGFLMWSSEGRYNGIQTGIMKYCILLSLIFSLWGYAFYV